MIGQYDEKQYKVIIIGAGQAGLSAGYFLMKYGIPFIILDANKRVGDSWRNRWNSLRLFTPAKFNGLAGLPFPAPPNYFPTKDEMADYLENYAAHFKLPVRTGIRVDRLSKDGNLFCIKSGEQNFLSENVIIAMSDFQNKRIPEFANMLNPDIVQIHSLDYKDPSQFQDGDILIVGAGNSGAEIALEGARNGHRVWLSGRDTGHVPFKIDSALSRIILSRLVMRVLFHRIFTTGTPIGRKVKPKLISKGGPLIKIKPDDFKEAGIRRVPRVSGVKEGFPILEDNQVIDVKNIVWCTGFHPSFSWIELPVFNDGKPEHNRGVIENEPGLYFTGLHFLYSFSSTMIHGAERDAQYVVKNIYNRINTTNPTQKIPA